MRAVKRLLAFVIVCLYTVGVSSCYSQSSLVGESGQMPATAGVHNNKYVIDISYDRKQEKAKAHQTVTFYNTEKVELGDIVFHLFPNAYRNKDNAPVIGGTDVNFPESFRPGYIKVSNVKVNGKSSKYDINNMIMTIKLDKKVKPGNSISIDMNFELGVPNGRGRFGSYKGVTQFAYWYPILAVYDNGWKARQYNRIGESNYSETADYEIDLTLDKNEKVAATGEIQIDKAADKSQENYKRFLITAANVRDFAMVCSKDFIIEESSVEGVKIKNYYLKSNESIAAKADETAAKVIKYYNSIFGKYPYKTFSIVNTYLYGGGMEYPQLIAMGPSLYESEAAMQHGIAHETAHQWWYVAVGNDEYKYPWLDEGMAVYSTELYTAGNSKDKAQLQKVMDKYRAGWIPELPVNSPVDKFGTWSRYSTVSYKMGAAALDVLRNRVGDERFFIIMSTYYKKYSLKNATPEEFIGVIGQVAGTKESDAFRRLVNQGF